MASWLRRSGAYPYDRPSSHTAADQASTASTSRPAAEGHGTRLAGARASRNLMESMQRLMRTWPGVKQLFEVAVKRNSLTASLVLLSSVLVADTLLVDQSQLKHFNLRAHLAQDHARSQQQQQQHHQQHSEQQHKQHQEQHFSMTHHLEHHHHHHRAAAAAPAGAASVQ